MANIKNVSSNEGKSYWIGDKEFCTFKTMAKDSDGAFALIELVALPGAEPPPHIHHTTDELYYILEGSLDVLDGERKSTANAGATVYIPKGTLHAWRNSSVTPTRALLLITPAGFEKIIEEVGVPGTLSSPPSPPPPPTPEDARRMQDLGRKYKTEYPSVPAW